MRDLRSGDLVRVRDLKVNMQFADNPAGKFMLPGTEHVISTIRDRQVYLEGHEIWGFSQARFERIEEATQPAGPVVVYVVMDHSSIAMPFATKALAEAFASELRKSRSWVSVREEQVRTEAPKRAVMYSSGDVDTFEARVRKFWDFEEVDDGWKSSLDEVL